MQLAIIAYSITAIIALVLGSLVYFKNMTSLINGFDPKRLKDIEGFTKWIGLHLLIISGLHFALLLYIYVSPSNTIIHVIHPVMLVVLLVSMGLGSRRYYR